ncbi:EAL domain-containing protein [Colwellia sp. M166]|uniref:putative bifunctional diguanylate cyclase/phosphodiesterase n=1 Tax=Colwellia sp. M166 TaxID=2583805 RepID=UPI00211F3C7E|nr:GGDEF domain-containing phosphodiesterase [Colwellia sp. M166]UUO22082.1 EAL domain-containing protein [Colwellia sp. M166]|tara:strand:+ start:7628 stop:9946 length:2319 start_codon:yes stop_codon:yes gene_type:complete
MAHKVSLRRQVTLLAVSLVILTVTCLLAVSLWKTITSHNQQINQRIISAENVLIEYLTAKEALLLTASKVLTADFGFKQAVASRDNGTIASVLENHGSRINASLMLLSDLNGEIISSNNDRFTSDPALAKNLNTIKLNLNKTQLMLIDGNLYQLIVLPVNAPRTIAYSVIGFQIDLAFINELKRLMAVEVSFFYNDALIITSLQHLDDLHNNYFNKMDNSWLLFQRKLYENKRITFTNSQNHDYIAQVSVDLSPSYIELDKLVSITLLISFFIIGFTAVASSIIAKNLTKPLQQLTQLSNDFAQGKYEHDKNMSNGSMEVNHVYDSFIKMGQKIQQRERKINYQAKHDSLTNIYNRSTFIDMLSKHIASHDHHSHCTLLVLAINIRNFKRINDSLGSDIGDLTLKSVAQRIKDIYQEEMVMIGRFSGDEFFIVINLANGECQQDIIENYLIHLKAPMQVNKLWLNLNFRLGACLFPEQSSNAKELVRRTTIALEAARNESKTIRTYQDGEDEAYLERLNLLEELRAVIAHNAGELFMVYQPKLNLDTGKIEKVESLIRWIKPDGQFISPELFIHLAEQSGLIIKLTHWVIDTVLKQQQAWRENNIELKVAINISAQDITHIDFVDFIFDTLAKYNADPNLITLEITERDIMTNEDLVISRLCQLKQSGIQISVDDYGIGQSSLGKLKQLPIDELKIDKAFILELDKSAKDQYIVQSTIELSHQLGFSVVAEGVENKASLDMLKAMKCNHVQGYYISRPINSAQLLTWLKTYE